MPIIYVISVILLITLALVVEKTKEKLEITKTIIFIFSALIAFNCLECYVLNLVNIPITLVTLSIVNYILNILISIKIFKDKKIQKYEFKKTNLIISLLFIIITICITLYVYDGVSKIRYVSMDSKQHYKAAREFSDNTALSNKATENNTTFYNFLPMAYTNVGIIFKILTPYIGTIALYKAYIWFEAFILFLIMNSFYLLIEQKINLKIGKIIAILFTIIYTIGYPFNAWISGFHYLNIGILYTQILLYTIIEKNKLKFIYRILFTFLINFGLIFAYPLFCPVVFLTEFLYFIYELKKDKNKACFIIKLNTLVIPGIIGITYLIIPTWNQLGKAIAGEGWLYKNLYSNFIWFVPFSLYYIYYKIKNKEKIFDIIMFIILVIFMLVLFIGNQMGKCSEYYFYKNYFVVWILFLYFSTNGLIKFYESEKITKIISIIFIAFYIFILAYSVEKFPTFISYKPNDSLKRTMDIYSFNWTMGTIRNSDFITKEQINVFLETEKIIEGKWKENLDKIIFIINPNEVSWLHALVGYPNKLYENRNESIRKVKEDYYDYIIILKNMKMYENLKEYINESNYKLIYEDKTGKILKK